jgi:FkbM family methyltransferase
VFNQVIIEEEYSKLLLMQNHEKENLVIIDAGANIGCTSLWFASYFPNAVIYAIEADASNFRYLEKNIRENKLSQSVLIYFNALWKDNSVLNISNSLRVGKEDSRRIILGNEENDNSVKGITLSDLNELVCGRRIDISKMDIEGAESELFPDLEHAKVFLDSIDILAVELHP